MDDSRDTPQASAPIPLPRSGAGNSLFRLAVHRLRRSPHLVVPAALAWLRGWYYKLKFVLSFRRVRIGRMFRVYGRLHVSGPGKLLIGDNCLIISNSIKPVMIKTARPEATIQLGDHCGLNGTSIHCFDSITMGPYCNVADAYVVDSPGHPLHPNRRAHDADSIETAPVVLEGNVWVSVQVVILHGVHIGRNSVIGACSLVRSDVPANVLAAGNPLRILKQLEGSGPLDGLAETDHA